MKQSMITQLMAVLSNFAPVIGAVVQTLRIAGAVKHSSWVIS
jgi:hypothetical protein